MPPFRAPPVVRSLLCAALFAWLGCASREVPAAYPESSPASPDAAAAPALQVTQALAGEPPPPSGAEGSSASDAGSPDAAPVDPHAHHRGHHHAH